MALHRGNAVSFLGTLSPGGLVRHYSHLHLLIAPFDNFKPATFPSFGEKNNNNLRS